MDIQSRIKLFCDMFHPELYDTSLIEEELKSLVNEVIREAIEIVNKMEVNEDDYYYDSAIRDLEDLKIK